MPPLTRIRTPALENLARQVRFSPHDTLRRQMLRAEELAGELDPGVEYPEDWLVFRITGYRPDIANPANCRGEEVSADLSALVERLSAAAKLAWNDPEGGEVIDAAALAEQWSVSRKTLERYRRRGLVARRVIGPRGRSILVFPMMSVARFEARRGEAVDGAAAFSRIGPALEERIVRRAARYRRRLKCSLNQAAARIAGRFGRSPETVRQLLMRHEAGAERPTFPRRGEAAPHARRVAWRAWRSLIEPSRIARKLSRSVASAHRLINEHRAHLLAGLDLPDTAEDLNPRVLAPAPVRSGLGAPGHATLAALLEEARRGAAPIGVAERARAAAYHALVSRAARGIRELPSRDPGAAELDRIETDLRWAARLKAELVRQELPLLIRTLEGQAGKKAEEIRAPVLAPMVESLLAALAEAVDAYGPGKGGRLAAPAGLTLSRAMSRWVRENPADFGGPGAAGRATPRLRGEFAIPDWSRRLAPWQEWLEPDARVRAGLERVDAETRAVLVERFGWEGPARTLAEVAGERGWTVIVAPRREREAQRAAIAAARGAGGARGSEP